MAERPSLAGLLLSLQLVTASLVQSSNGPCVVNGNCVCSSNFPGAACSALASTNVDHGHYGNYESCQIDFKQPLMLSVHWFEVEPSPTWFDVEYLRILGREVEPTCGYDSLTVDGIKYCGTSVPDHRIPDPQPVPTSGGAARNA